MESDSNANTTAVEMIVSHDPTNEIMYNSMVMRIMGDISIEQTTVQGPDGINYELAVPTLDLGTMRGMRSTNTKTHSPKTRGRRWRW